MKKLRHSGEDQGSAAVEFALVLPVLLVIIFGVIDFGRMLNAKITLSQATHDGARAAAVAGPDAANETITKAMGSLAPGMTITQLSACEDASDVDATVTVTYGFSYVTPLAVLIGLGGDGTTLSSTAVVPCQ
ncbi:MAG TPA: TadE family protein [Micromonosporaceae bacterium]